MCVWVEEGCMCASVKMGRSMRGCVKCVNVWPRVDWYWNRGCVKEGIFGAPVEIGIRMNGWCPKGCILGPPWRWVLE